MGRPLKISKSQAVITLGNTYAANNNMNVSNTAGLLPGMPFKVATTTGNLTAGTTYYVLSVASSTIMQASATPLDQNVTGTAQTLTNAGPVTVNMTVGQVDTGFNNPDGSANTYGVVGGLNTQYGNTIAANVAIGIAGEGTISATSGNTLVFGFQANLANMAAGAAIAGNGTQLGFVASNVTNTFAVTSTVDSGDFIVTSGNASNLAIGQPVRFTDSISTIVANTLYYVSSVANSTHFTITTAPGFSTYPVGSVTAGSNAVQETMTLAAPAAATYLGNSWSYANDEVGYIVRQKGKSKFLVTGTVTGLTGVCQTANLAAAALTANTMRIVGTYANAGTNLVQTLSDKNSKLFGTGDSLANAESVYATFNTAAAANASPGQIYPVVQITNS